MEKLWKQRLRSESALGEESLISQLCGEMHRAGDLERSSAVARVTRARGGARTRWGDRAVNSQGNCDVKVHWCGEGVKRGVAGRAASTGRVGSGIQEEFKHPWERKVYLSVLGVGWLVKARRTMMIGTLTVSHVG